MPARYEIAISTTLLSQTFGDVQRPVRVNGLLCRDRVEALQRIFEHELLHLLEMLIWTKSSCSAPRYKALAWSYFGHTETKHDLITQHERASHHFGIRVGDRVAFRVRGRASRRRRQPHHPKGYYFGGKCERGGVHRRQALREVLRSPRSSGKGAGPFAVIPMKTPTVRRSLFRVVCLCRRGGMRPSGRGAGRRRRTPWKSRGRRRPCCRGRRPSPGDAASNDHGRRRYISSSQPLRRGERHGLEGRRISLASADPTPRRWKSY